MASFRVATISPASRSIRGREIAPASRFGLRLEGRVYGTVLDSESKIFCASSAEGSGCLISTQADVLWQWEMMLGAIMRF